jgi:OFA family oxalate/formate antiporter-like MFS transporter
LAAGVVAVMAVANLQYTWTLFTAPLTADLSARLSQVQIGFTLFILAQTWLAPAQGWLADRWGARPLALVGGAFVAANWIGAGVAHSLGALYAACALGGFGCGLVMSVSGGVAVREFPGRRGLAVGLSAAAYGLGPLLAIAPIRWAISALGWRAAFIGAGLVQGGVLLAAAAFLGGGARGAAAPSPASGTPPRAMLRTGRFWLMYAILALVAFGGLLITAQFVPIARSFRLGDEPLLLGLDAVVLALMLDRLTNAASRPFWGWLSDRLGRSETMALAFAAEALAILGLLLSSGHPLLFVLQSGVTFFAWGEIFSLFPAVVADAFGPEHAMANYGLLFTAKGTASIFAGWGVAWLIERSLAWTSVLWAALACDLLAAALTFFLLRPALARAASTSSKRP